MKRTIARQSKKEVSLALKWDGYRRLYGAMILFLFEFSEFSIQS